MFILPNNAKAKSQLRQHFRDACKRIPSLYRHEAARSAANILAEQILFQQSQHIACYLPIKNEFETNYIIEKIWQSQKNCYLPVVQKGNILSFVIYKKNTELCLNQYSIYEPKSKIEMIAPEDLDLVVTPLVSFDLCGHRLGAGGGFYDRTFQFLTETVTDKKPRLLGLAYSIQQADVLMADEWDVKLNAALTESNFFQFK